MPHRPSHSLATSKREREETLQKIGASFICTLRGGHQKEEMAVLKKKGLSLSLTNSLGGLSKEGRRLIKCGVVDVVCLEINESDRRHAARMEPFVKRSRAPSHSDPGFVAYNRIQKLEYDQLYAAEGLDPANQELTALSAAAVVRGLRLSPGDTFLDLGSATGVLTLVAASKCRKAAGVELSRSSHEIADEAKGRFLESFPLAQVDFFATDLRHFSATTTVEGGEQRLFDVIYCGIRGHRSRPKVISAFFETLLKDLDRPIRFVCAGFGLDDTPLPPCQIHLRHIYCIKKQYCNPPATTDATTIGKKNNTRGGDDDTDDIQSTTPLYGDHRGPRLLLEYIISPPTTTP